MIIRLAAPEARLALPLSEAVVAGPDASLVARIARLAEARRVREEFAARLRLYLPALVPHASDAQRASWLAQLLDDDMP